jgi:hypothetical protein
MAASRWHKKRRLFEGAGVELAPGLTEAQLLRVEGVLRHSLPPDLRGLLAEFLPIGGHFPNWRDPESNAIRDWLDAPGEGIASRVRAGLFWWASWGERPTDPRAASDLARVRLADVPRLCPIYSHRYLPLEPPLAGNPVLSVYGTDIVYYGNNLSAYLQHEFRRSGDARQTEREPRRIRFWSDLVAANNQLILDGDSTAT